MAKEMAIASYSFSIDDPYILLFLFPIGYSPSHIPISSEDEQMAKQVLGDGNADCGSASALEIHSWRPTRTPIHNMIIMYSCIRYTYK